MRKCAGFIGFLFVLSVLFLFVPGEAEALRGESYERYNQYNSPLIFGSVHMVESDPDGGMWFMEDGAGAFYRSPEGEWTNYREANSRILNNYVRSFDIGPDGVKYFGSGIGVSELYPDGSWKTYNEWTSELPAPSITALAAGADGKVWYGVSDRGLSVRDKDGIWQHYRPGPSPTLSLPNHNIQALELDDNGGIWVGLGQTLHRRGGAAYLSAEGSWTHYHMGNSDIPADNVMDILAARDGSIWFATRASGLAQLKEGKWTVYNVKDTPLRSDLIRDLAEDPQGNIWAATRGGGIAKIGTQGEVDVFMNHNSMLRNNYVNSLDFDHRGNLWIGYGLGLIEVKNVAAEEPERPDKITIFIDGRQLFVDVAPVVENNRTLVPVRAFLERLGHSVEWIEEERKILVTGEYSIKMRIGNDIAVVDGSKVELETVPRIVDGRALVPLRWAGNTLGADVHWDADAQRITVWSR